MTHTLAIKFTLNGESIKRDIKTSLLLSDLLRDAMRLRGLKLSCGRGVCGACTVLVDGLPAVSCATFAFEVDGRNVLTIEGLKSENDAPDAVQAAFANLNAFQCGYCTPGMIMLTRALLNHDPHPDDETIISWISSNICRCTGYQMIIEAVREAARLERTGS